MKAWQIEAFGALSPVQVERPAPVVGPGQALVRVRAVALNYRDLRVLEGSYDPRLALPFVPCSDLAGEVLETGPGVRRVKVGDRVLSSFAQAWVAGRPTQARLRSTLGSPLPGVLATHVVLDAEGLVHAPAYLPEEAACTLPCAALTAWHALVDHGALQPGQTVLVQGTGGVSLFAAQIARLLGATVVGTSAKPAGRATLHALGASTVIDRVLDPAWGKTVRAATSGLGVDHVVEVGGAQTLAQSLRAVSPGGIVHVIGVLSGARESFDVLPVLMNEVRMQGIMVGPRDSLEAMIRAFCAHRLMPIVDRTFSFDEVPAAFAHLRSGTHVGKVCVALP